MAQLCANNAVSLLYAPINSTDTRIDVLAGMGYLFPAISSPEDFFVVTLEDQTQQHREIVKVTARNNDTFTVVRGFENTLPRVWGLRTLVDLRDTSGTMKRLQPVINDTIAVNLDPDTFYRITSSEPFAPRSTQLWIGGMRQALGKDYIEENNHTIKLLYQWNQSDFDNGVNLVLDFYRL
jgi:hypothetical protein